ncbi:hypothetical protein FQZ97_1112510 [compost metagenome]
MEEGNERLRGDETRAQLATRNGAGPLARFQIDRLRVQILQVVQLWREAQHELDDLLVVRHLRLDREIVSVRHALGAECQNPGAQAQRHGCNGAQTPGGGRVHQQGVHVDSEGIDRVHGQIDALQEGVDVARGDAITEFLDA